MTGWVLVRTRDGAELQDDATWKKDADPAVFESITDADDVFADADWCHSKFELREYVEHPDPAKRTYTVIGRTR